MIDMFAGSGSTLIGAEQTGRSAYCAELDPMNVDVIIRRWQEFTKQQATHETEKGTFEQIAAARAKAAPRKARTSANR